MLVNGHQPGFLPRRPLGWLLGAFLGLYCRRCGRWWRHALVCPGRVGR